MCRRVFTICLVALWLAPATALDVVITKQPTVVHNASCTEYYLPPLDLCTDCTARRTTMTVEPHSSSPAQLVTVTDVGGTPADTIVVVDNTGFAKMVATRTNNGYMLCSLGSDCVTGFTVATDVLLTKTPVPLPLPPALPIAQTWVSPDNAAAFVQIDGVVADVSGCIHAGANTPLAECMQLCIAMDTCVDFVRTGTSCDLCTDPAALTATWVLAAPGANVFLRGKSIHLFVREPEHSVTIYNSAFPGHQRTLDSLFTITAVFFVAVFAFIACYTDLGDRSLAWDRNCHLKSGSANDLQSAADAGTGTPPRAVSGGVGASALGADGSHTHTTPHETEPLLASQRFLGDEGVVHRQGPPASPRGGDTLHSVD
jgi:hypothetical protein